MFPITVPKLVLGFVNSFGYKQECPKCGSTKFHPPVFYAGLENGKRYEVLIIRCLCGWEYQTKTKDAKHGNE